MTRNSAIITRDDAREFASKYVKELSTELLQWKHTGLLPDGKIRELSDILKNIYPQDSLEIAENFTKRAALEMIARIDTAAQTEPLEKKQRVLIMVSGGVADYNSDTGISVEIFDWDDYKDSPDEVGGVSAKFADLAQPYSIPVSGENVAPKVKQSERNS